MGIPNSWERLVIGNSRELGTPEKACTGGADVIRKETWPFYGTISGVRLCWELEQPNGPEGQEPSLRNEPASGTKLLSLCRALSLCILSLLSFNLSCLFSLSLSLSTCKSTVGS